METVRKGEGNFNMKTKRKIMVTAILMMLILAFQIQSVYASQGSTGAAGSVYTVTVSFDANSGSGVMQDLVVRSDEDVRLPLNAFTRADFQFIGWALAPGGEVVYEDGGSVAGLATAENHGGKITLYAQWQMNKPRIRSLEATSLSDITVTYEGNAAIAGLEIQYATDRTFHQKQEKTVAAAAGSTSVKLKLTGATSGKTYYVRLRGYCKNGDAKIYSDWSDTGSVKMPYKVTIAFHKNGGTGTMKKQTVLSSQTSKLSANKFKKSSFKFAGWAKSKNGKVVYQNKEDVRKLATKGNNGKTITLYAQWKPNTPTIRSAKSTEASSIMVTYKGNKGYSGYQIRYSTNQKFKESKTSTISVGKGSTSARLTGVVPDKLYYIQIRSAHRQGGRTIYSDWSKSATARVAKGSTLENTKCYAGIEADVKLSGSGSGYHAKLVIGSPMSAVSFGMQYDTGAAAPYGSRNMALIENVANPQPGIPGGQSYERPSDYEFEQNKSYHLMLTMDEKGNGKVFVNYEQIGSFSQPALKKGMLYYIGIEVAARLNGDSVDAEFSNVKTRKGKEIVSYTGDRLKPVFVENRNGGLHYKTKGRDTFRLYGTINGISGDWDSEFDKVSEVLQFVRGYF